MCSIPNIDGRPTIKSQPATKWWICSFDFFDEMCQNELMVGTIFDGKNYRHVISKRWKINSYWQTDIKYHFDGRHTIFVINIVKGVLPPPVPCLAIYLITEWNFNQLRIGLRYRPSYWMFIEPVIWMIFSIFIISNSHRPLHTEHTHILGIYYLFYLNNIHVSTFKYYMQFRNPFANNRKMLNVCTTTDMSNGWTWIPNKY